ncbi:ABC transporter substrate-binding protein [Breznakiella homolactica]|uniref:Extracellular solute-binding protein n=1 Tax=Breznakiella homolactica TaxID=2798577 RepID=A0A7T7XPF0_9SPIR|nr:extracellular solute-binding protein [Breznakiella homolactica]QQO10081.1 extracellular solute-binding protein [Breznakiella homolactica]
MKRFVLCSVLAAMCAAVFAGGSQDGAKLVVWDKSEYVAAYNEQSKARLEEFGRNNNIAIEYVIVPPNDLRSKLFAAIEAKNPPDIVLTDDFLAKQFAGMNQLADVSEILNAVPFTKSGRDLAFNEAGNYVVPVAMLAPGLYLRKDKWEAAGLPYPKTWLELLDHARKVNDPANDFYALGYPMGASGGGDAEGMVRSVILSFGGIPVDKDGKVTVNSPQSLEALKYIAQLYQENLCPPSAITWDDMGNNTAYIAGSVGVIQNSPSVFSQLKSENPDLYGKTAILSWPSGPAGNFTLTGGNAYIIFKNGKQTEMAKKYITEFFELEFYKNLVIQMGGMWQPVVEKADLDPFWELPENKGWLEASRGGVPNTHPAPANELTTKAFAEQLCVKAVQKIVLRNMDPQAALNELEADLKRVLNQR